MPIKGHITATRFATESRPRVFSGLYAEDPESPGQAIMAGEDGDDLGSAIIGLHYSNVAEKLNQPVLKQLRSQTDCRYPRSSAYR